MRWSRAIRVHGVLRNITEELGHLTWDDYIEKGVSRLSKCHA